MGTIHRLAPLREQKPMPTLPAHAAAALHELGIFNMGPIIGFELWGRGPRSAVMMVDEAGAALNACLSPSYPSEGFATRSAARAWAVAFFAGLGRDIPERRKPRYRPAENDAGVSRMTRQGNLPPDAPILPRGTS